MYAMNSRAFMSLAKPEDETSTTSTEAVVRHSKLVGQLPDRIKSDPYTLEGRRRRHGRSQQAHRDRHGEFSASPQAVCRRSLPLELFATFANARSGADHRIFFDLLRCRIPCCTTVAGQCGQVHSARFCRRRYAGESQRLILRQRFQAGHVG
jgi:hypothetical protein